MKILLVEDDPAISQVLATTLTSHRYTVDVATDGKTGLELATLWTYDLLLLDIELPNLDGLTICRQMRLSGHTTPILMLTAKDETTDVIQGLDSGADDYMTKPCDPSQLLARIRALLRRGGASVSLPILMWGDLCLDPATAQVTYQGEILALRPKEYNLLELFLRYPQRVFNRSTILDHLWTAEDFPTENAVTNLIKDLRHRLKSAGIVEEIIETVYGLGYRLKATPINTTETVALKSASEGESIDLQENLALLDQVRSRFQNSLNQRLAVLEAIAADLQADRFSVAQFQSGREEAHRLTGSLGTFGCPEGSELARAIEQWLQTYLDGKPGNPEQFQHLLARLKQVIAYPATTTATAVSSLEPIPLVLLINSDDDFFAEGLQHEAIVWGLQVDKVPSGPINYARLKQSNLAVILLDLQESTPREPRGFVLLQELKQHFPEIPILTLAEQNTLTNRIQTARLGSDRYLPKPIAPAQVLELAARMVPQTTTSQATVMIVDDDPVILAALSELLKPWGMNTISLSNPDDFWTVLTQSNPDLLLLDLEMPTFNGIELCQVVRQDSRYGDLPILVVTAHTDLESIQRAFEAGADDLIYKPIAGPELITRVTSRIERSQLRQQLDRLRRQQAQDWQHQARVDPLTQIPNRRAFSEYLGREWQRLGQEQEPLSLILCDVDCFKAYNDRFGHPAGDTCLKRIAFAIQESINPSSDLVARYGGEEFGVILPNTNLNGALRVAERIQQAIHRLQIAHPDSAASPFVTISLGITGTVPTIPHSIEDLISAADQALYAAKERGRNTYCLYPL